MNENLNGSDLHRLGGNEKGSTNGMNKRRREEYIANGKEHIAMRNANRVH